MRSIWRRDGFASGVRGAAGRRFARLAVTPFARYYAWCNETEDTMKTDFLEELINERSVRNPNFPALVQAAAERRELLRALAKEREASGFTQTEVAAAMGTSQSQIARLESANIDAKLSTVEKLAAVLGKRVEWRLKDAAH